MRFPFLKRYFSKTLLFSIVISHTAFAWDGHLLLTYSALEHSQLIDLKPSVPAETLEEFLKKESEGLKQVLEKNEEWSRQAIQHYPRLPDSIKFQNLTPHVSIQTQFLKSIRVNPEMQFPLFVQYPPGKKHRIARKNMEESSVVSPELAHSSTLVFPGLPLERVESGDLLSPLEILSTATDEPDYGMDVNVWENNNSWFGKLYGMGEQPFGNHTIVFSSQTPFHMGFYYESNLIYKAAPFIQRSYPEYRIHQYLTLSRYAFSTGHAYWGYRFLGWALHYAQDLSQPYHSTLSPNHSTARLLYVSFLKLLGMKNPEQQLVQLLTNRHTSFENYVYYYLGDLFENQKQNKSALLAIADSQHDKRYPLYSDNYPREIIAKESNNLAKSMDSVIKNVFPRKYVDDSDYIFYETEKQVNLFNLVKDQDNINELNQTLIELLRNAGAHTRNIVKYAVSADNGIAH